MTHQEINPKQWKEWIDKKIQRDASKFNDNIQASTDMYTCKKCRSTRCTYYEMQTRSADEPATIFVTCLDCGKHFRS
jgi:DNA-directed RNA polymerase subunit M/transcription elongation factor TFIIS